MQYDLEMTQEQSIRFKRLVRVEMLKRELQEKDMAELVGYSAKSIYLFFSSNGRSRFIAAALAEKLGIREEDWK